MSAAIELRGVSKRYVKLEEQAMLLRSLMPFARPRRSDLLALRDVNLRVEPGETVGILGRNGAGKTTMLRLLAGVSQPSAGHVSVRGRVAPLISVGVGFHEEMSGRENVYVNGMLLGLSRDEIEQRFDRIVEFAELGGFIDTPVKFYSSGMFMRLGFSVAVHVEPEVLLVDEVLAVGDLGFQLKCFERMRELKARGATILLVSHSMHAIRLLCPRAVLFRGGELVFDGDSDEAISRHYELMSLDGAAGDPASVSGAVSFLDRGLIGPDGAPVHQADQDTPLAFRLRMRFEQAVDSPHLIFGVTAEDGTRAYEMWTAVGRRYRRFEAGEEAEVEIAFEPRLGGGTYRFTTTVVAADGKSALAHDDAGTLLYLPPPLGTAGVADLRATITLGGELLTDHPPLLLDG